MSCTRFKVNSHSMIYRFTLYKFSVPPGSKNIFNFIHFLINCGHTSEGCPNSVLKWHPRNVLRTWIWKYITIHITVVLFLILLPKMCCVKYWKLSCYIFLQFWTNVLWTFSKLPKKDVHRVTPVGRPQDVNFEPISQCIFTTLF